MGTITAQDKVHAALVWLQHARNGRATPVTAIDAAARLLEQAEQQPPEAGRPG